jgi:hypothetical protein
MPTDQHISCVRFTFLTETLQNGCPFLIIMFPFVLAWVVANGDSHPNCEIDQLLAYRGQSHGRAGARPYRKKTPGVKPGVCTFSAGVRSFLMSDLEHHRQCECAGLIRREFPVASNPARGGVGKDAWTGYCLHIGDVPG